MEVTVERDLLVAALIAFAVHVVVVAAGVPHGYSPIELRGGENKNLEISLVSTYREVEQPPPVRVADTFVEKRTEKVRQEKPEKERSMKDRYHEVSPPRELEKRPLSPPSEGEITEVSEEAKINSAVPKYRENSRPPYPPLARKRGYEGTTVLSLYVREDGTVGEIVVTKTSGHSILDRAASKTAQNWLFEPASRMGRTIPLWVDVPVRFMITEGDRREQ
jgi:protein TonB